jgi:hypothetical protein
MWISKELLWSKIILFECNNKKQNFYITLQQKRTRGVGGETDLEIVYNLGLIYKVCLQYSYIFILFFKIPMF